MLDDGPGAPGGDGPPQPVGQFVDVAGEPVWFPEKVSVDADGFVRVEGGASRIPLDDYVSLRESSVHNPDSGQLMLGRWTSDDSSYIARAQSEGATYFDMGYKWDTIQDWYGPTNKEMFQLFNKPVLDEAILEGKTIRFPTIPNSLRMPNARFATSGTTWTQRDTT